MGKGLRGFAFLLALSAVSGLADRPALAGGSLEGLSTDSAARLVEPQALAGALADHGEVRVIVEFATPQPPDGAFDLASRAGVEGLIEAVAEVQDRILDRALGPGTVPPRTADAPDRPDDTGLGLVRFDGTPMFALNADAALLRALAEDPEVQHIHIDHELEQDLNDTIQLIGMNSARPFGANGAGQTVVVIDSGTLATHEFLSGSIAGEGCFNANAVAAGRDSFCPTGSSVSLATGAACTRRNGQLCNHGTHVAGIAAGSRAPASIHPFLGVAPEARVFAINAMSCAQLSGSTCERITALTSDTIAAMAYVFNHLRFQREVAAVNVSMSRANAPASAACTTSPPRAIIASLRNVGIATVVSAGNDGFDDAVNHPYACVPEAIAVANTTRLDARRPSSNWGALVAVAAPGTAVFAPIGTTDRSYGQMSGTSMAAPHVAGAIAAIRTLRPAATVAQVQTALRDTGTPVADAGRSHRRINVDAALIALGVDLRPPNNLFANRTVIPEPRRMRGRNFGATSQPGQPSIAAIGSTNAVWWRFTAPENGLLAIDTFGSNFNTTLGVFTGTTVSALAPVAANVNAGSGLQSRVWIEAEAGRQYQIAVAGRFNATGNIVLNTDFSPPRPTWLSLDVPAQVTAGVPATIRATIDSLIVPDGEISLRRGSVEFSRQRPDANGQVSVTTSFSEGSHVITAQFPGSTAFLPSSAMAEITATRLPTFTTINGPTTGTVGEPVTFNVLVVSGLVPVEGGTVILRRGQIQVASAQLNASGFASFTTTLTAGTHHMTAEFTGSPTLAPSTSNVLTVAIDRRPTTTTLTAPAEGLAGQSLTFSALVEGPSGPIQSGTVFFRRDGEEFARRALNSQGIATVSAVLPVGTHRVTANYIGSAVLGGSTSAPQTLEIRLRPTTTVLSGPTEGMLGEPLIFRATVTSPHGAPTGAVRLLRSTEEIGYRILGVDGTVEFTTDRLREGNNLVRAEYMGDPLFAPSMGTPLLQVRITAPTPALTQIAAGRFHSCAVGDNGRAYCWGRNRSGQLGNGSRVNRNEPVRAGALVDVVEVAVGDAHSCARIASGQVFCWGAGASGQIGNGQTGGRVNPNRVLRIQDAVGIAAGGAHSCALRANGRVLCWGRNAAGQLGDGTAEDRPSPVRVRSLGRATQIAAGGSHSCAVRENGLAFCWGANGAGQLGDGTRQGRTEPVRVAGLNRLTQVAAGGAHSCALRTSGRVFCWGRNRSGQLGDRSTTNRRNPVRVVTLAEVAQVTAGDQHSCAVRDDGDAFCWGGNAAGQLGNGRTNDRPRPVGVAGANRFTEVTAGGRHSCALRRNGRGFCWGANAAGQLGDGSDTPSPVPVRVR